jgi:hypothetical protein
MYSSETLVARLAEVGETGSYRVETWMGGWDSQTVHQTREEALEAARRPSEKVYVWKGDYALHRGGWVSWTGEETLVAEGDEDGLFELVDAA